MAGQYREDGDEGIRSVEAHHPFASPVVVGGAFALGLVAGLFLKGTATQAYQAARRGQWRRDYKRTVTYDQNLPDSLGRREPMPEAGQPRYGGTGALGVPPAAVRTP
jgi:hypothetical protein